MTTFFGTLWALIVVLFLLAAVIMGLAIVVGLAAVVVVGISNAVGAALRHRSSPPE